MNAAPPFALQNASQRIRVAAFIGAVALWLGATASWAAAPQRDWPLVPPPPDARSYWIAQYIEQNTVPMQIRGFETDASVAEVARWYEAWFKDKVGYAASQVGEVRVLGARMGIYQVTVQLRGTPGKTLGRLASAALYEEGGPSEQERTDRIGKGFPRPPGSQVVSDTLSFDPGQRNRTIMLTNGMSVETNALYLRERMVLLGWALLQDRTVEAGTRSALVFRRGTEEMVVTIARQEGSCFVVASQTTPE
ncbi:hypothetical protein RCH10_004637 [Variovorax sp. GrIS 2.14]|uniref:hypothetical protein n=1 Tax=Variovorax sp. GrIS 2.14 TaxID=3071709 RepID=UPI0038F69969